VQSGKYDARHLAEDIVGRLNPGVYKLLLGSWFARENIDKRNRAILLVYRDHRFISFDGLSTRRFKLNRFLWLAWLKQRWSRRRKSEALLGGAEAPKPDAPRSVRWFQPTSYDSPRKV
jgi:hypothetical protein